MESSQSSETRQCVLHVDEDPQARKRAKQHVKSFDAKKWDAVRSAATSRLAKPNFTESKYRDVVLKLPEVPRDSDGFHHTCYQKFTAVRATTNGEKVSGESSLSQSGSEDSRDTTELTVHSGTDHAECLFCKQKSRKQKRNKVETVLPCETLEAADNIIQAAKKHQDSTVLSKFSVVDLVLKEVKFHGSCKSSYVSKAKRRSSTNGLSITNGSSSSSLWHSRPVLVYGTLMTGEPNEFILQKSVKNSQAELLGRATTTDCWPLIIYSEFNIPFLLDRKGTGKRVTGELWRCDTETLDMMDDLEKHPIVYTRITTTVTLDSSSDDVIECDMYVLRRFRRQMLDNAQYLSFYHEDADRKFSLPNDEQAPGVIRLIKELEAA